MDDLRRSDLMGCLIVYFRNLSNYMEATQEAFEAHRFALSYAVELVGSEVLSEAYLKYRKTLELLEEKIHAAIN